LPVPRRLISGLFAIEREQMSKAIKLGSILANPPWKLSGQLRIRRITRTAVTSVAVLAAILLLATALAVPSKILANDDDLRTFVVDVGFRNPYFQNNVDPLQNSSLFSPGDTFLQYGNIYPGGTIPRGTTDFDPDTAPGAIGVYLARGTWTTNLDGFNAAKNDVSNAPSDLAFATEILSFNADRGTILTDGILPNAHYSARRVVLGGTRSFREIIGDVHEENIGENGTSGYCNLRLNFKIRKSGDAHWR
jgi:hypothetical protein